jgi:hypothetical protein
MSDIFSAVASQNAKNIHEKPIILCKFSVKVFRFPNDIILCHLWAGTRSRDGYGWYLQIVCMANSESLLLIVCHIPQYTYLQTGSTYTCITTNRASTWITDPYNRQESMRRGLRVLHKTPALGIMKGIQNCIL